MSAGLPRIGETLAGKYQLVGILGEGGMACVFEATRTTTNERVAIKVLTPELARDPGIVARFQREARAVGLLKTRHVAHVLDVDATDGGVPFIVMEFLEGRDLEAELEARGALPLAEVVDYVLQACAAMMEAHSSGIIHRDLKPANLFVTKGENGAERIVKVIDFGISKILGDATRLTGAGAVMGTVLYMPPEQIRATTDVDHRADVWAFGVILFELLAGRAPWEGAAHKVAAEIVSSDAPDVRKFAPVSEGVASVIRKMLQRNPDARYSSITEVVQALAPFAPPNSLGAAIARGALPATGPRQGRTMPLAMVPLAKMTVPMAAAPPSNRERAPISGREPPPSSRDPTPPSSRHEPVPAAKAPRSQHAAFFAGFFIMLLVAGGVILVLVAVRGRRPSPMTLASSALPPASSVAPPEPLDSSAPTSTPTTSAEESASTGVPAPPPTGTTRPTPASATPSRSAARPQPSAATTNPNHL